MSTFNPSIDEARDAATDTFKLRTVRDLLRKPLCLLFLVAVTQFLTLDSLAAIQKERDSQHADATQQIEQDDQKEKLATIRGSLKMDSDLIKEVDWDSFNGSLGQLIVLKQPNFPENWAEMVPEKRREWIASFLETKEGKSLQEENRLALENRHRQDFIIRDKGEFVVYDVPRGRFEMRIVGQKEIGDATYVMQAYGQFEVGEVDELDFSNMKLEVLRLIKIGEQAPEIKGKSTDGQPVALSDFNGKHVLLAFGACGNPAFELTTRALKEAANSEELADKLAVLTVTVDEDENVVAEFNKKNEVTWGCLNLGGWDQDTLNNYGLKAIPSLWLIDPDGKVVITGQQFLIELNRTKFPVAKLVAETLAGRLTIGGDPDESKSPTEADK